MKLEIKNDVNYAATVIRVKNLVKLENADRLLGLPLFGYQAIVGLNTEVGELGILFPAECQLDARYCAMNNLFRHKEKNIDGETVGYIEDNRRVRAIKLRGNRSDALFMPLNSLSEATPDWANLKEGDQFDTIDGIEVCRKYVRKERHPREFKGQPKAEPRIDKKFFPEHFDSMHYARVDRSIAPEAHVIITQKLHGTSIRIGHVPVKRKLSLLERVGKKLGLKVQETEYAHVFGSRKVIKDANNPNQMHFYDHDLWTDDGRKVAEMGVIPKGYILYAEIIGWTDGGGPIQSNYTYDCLPGTRKLYVYRISYVNPDGVVSDLSWDAVKAFCLQAGLNHVPELARHEHRLFIPHGWIDRKFHEEGLTQAVPLAPESPCDEGVCIRIEGIIPEIYKHKSPVFLQHETKMLDNEVMDIETEGNLVADETQG